MKELPKSKKYYMTIWGQKQKDNITWFIFLFGKEKSKSMEVFMEAWNWRLTCGPTGLAMRFGNFKVSLHLLTILCELYPVKSDIIQTD